MYTLHMRVLTICLNVAFQKSLPRLTKLGTKNRLSMRSYHLLEVLDTLETGFTLLDVVADQLVGEASVVYLDDEL